MRATDEGVELARDELLSYHPHVCARVIRRALRRVGHAADGAGTRSALAVISSGSSGRRVILLGGVRIEREFDRIGIEPGTPRPAGGVGDRHVVVQGPRVGTVTACLGGR